MSAALTSAMKKTRRCAKPNSEQSISGVLIALVIAFVLGAAVALDMPRLVAMVIS